MSSSARRIPGGALGAFDFDPSGRMVHARQGFGDDDTSNPGLGFEPLPWWLAAMAMSNAGRGRPYWVFALVGTTLLAFLFLVALGVDYNIFLVTRAAEEGREHGPRKGMLRALTATGGVITSAGVIFASAFVALIGSSVHGLAQTGFAVAVGLLLDTFVVRTLVVPACAALLEDYNWWPIRPSTGEADEAALSQVESRESTPG